jgi:hypothetical protein
MLSVTAILLVGSCGWLRAQEHQPVPVTITGCVASPSSDTQPLLHTHTTSSHKGKPDYIKWSATDHDYMIEKVSGDKWPFAKSSYLVKAGHSKHGEIDSATQTACSSTTTTCNFVYQITGCAEGEGQGPTAVTVGPAVVHFKMHVKG